MRGLEVIEGEAILDTVIRGGFSEEVTFKQRPR